MIDDEGHEEFPDTDNIPDVEVKIENEPHEQIQEDIEKAIADGEYNE